MVSTSTLAGYGRKKLIFSHFDTIAMVVVDLYKLLKRNAFNIENSLDTRLFRTIRFRQKVLAEFAFR
jgi:hypothetical protein